MQIKEETGLEIYYFSHREFLLFVYFVRTSKIHQDISFFYLFVTLNRNYLKDGKRFVYEASKTVKLTPMNEWIKRGKDKKYIVKRLIKSDSLLSDSNLLKLKKAGELFDGKPYDLYFEWNNDRIYCSELVWKIYKNALGIEIGELKKVKDFNLSDPEVKKILEKRYGNEIPLDETVISPESMFNSGLLKTVFKN